MPKSLPEQPYLRSRLEYNFDTGIFIHKHKAGADRYTKSWNTRHAGTTAGYQCKGRKYITIDDKHYFEHRVLWKWLYGDDPPDQIDHIDHDQTNNHPSNLRSATNKQNGWNKAVTKNSLVGIKGVSERQDGRGWYARADNRYLGTFATPEEAAEAYRIAATEVQGEYLHTSISGLLPLDIEPKRLEHPRGMSGERGVEMHPDGRYRARLWHKNRNLHLGLFDSLDDAIEARQRAEAKYRQGMTV